MTDELRAAAERIKNKWTISSKLVDEEGELHFGYVQDLAILADAWMAEHPDWMPDHRREIGK